MTEQEKISKFTEEAFKYFPIGSVTTEERQAWIDTCVKDHPGFTAEQNFKPDDLPQMLFQRQSTANGILSALSDAMGQSQAEIVSILAHFTKQDEEKQAEILAILKDSHAKAEQTRTENSMQAEKLLRDVSGEQALRDAELLSGITSIAAVLRDQHRGVWYWRGGIAAIALAAVVELGVLITR